MKKNKKVSLTRKLSNHIKEHKKLFAIYVVLRILVVETMIFQFFNGNYENVFLCLLTLFLFTIPSFIEVNFHIDVPDTLEVIVLLFIFSAEILGEIREYYIAFPFWDTMLHTINGFLAAAIGFSLVDLLNRHDKFSFKLSPIYLAICAFCFSMTIGVLWEFFEFGMDFLFKTDMQKDTVLNCISTVSLHPNGKNIPIIIDNIKSVTINGKDLGLSGYLDIGLIDTMKDLFVNFIGAIVFSFIGYFYIKKRGEGKVAKRFIPKYMDIEEDVDSENT
ncbi:hypothetical protein JYG23_10675 [Sedimentibacter sp. zth1]|uniref:hypothetical protein n=1 Tax=Sedimentibacter sp. zth1 TaxID=2816908 RepID=UPI001A9361A2|nr:hypothetical protein [Sedimentibacter sp. zth1]QSX05144.1 hypothetical protein JYG23_10675 [Sedimentibacter sp. zth1]